MYDRYQPEKILCPTIHVHRQHDCSYVDVGTVCYTVSRSMFVWTLPYHTYFLRASLVNVCSLDIVREIEDLKSSKYIKALICFLVLHTRMKEKHQFSSINYSRLLLKKITGTGKITRKRST